MKIEWLPIPGLALIDLELKSDERGFFCERFHREKFRELGLPQDFVQMNQSWSLPRVLRGLHYQPGQGKLVGCTRGRIFDVAVDIRPRSATYGEHFATCLSDVNGKLLWIPDGFAHGFCVLGEETADVVYLLTTPHDPGREAGYRWDCNRIRIPWPYSQPITSERDKTLPPLGVPLTLLRATPEEPCTTKPSH